MTRIRTVGGTITKTSTGATTVEVLDGHFKSNAAQQNYWVGDKNGNTHHEYKAPEKKEEEKKEGVKEIECLTALDYGSDNDTYGGFKNTGMVFGKTYHFRVKSYVKDVPKNRSDIKWLLVYHNLSENKLKEIPLAVKGDNVKITMNDLDLCGRFVYVRAYLKDHKTEAELKVWKHNRFRWFDRMIVEKEIKERTDDKKPWLINQSGTSLCGMACLFYLFAKEKPDLYKKFAKELFRKGVATFNGYTVKPSIDVLERRPFINGKLNEKNFPWHWEQINKVNLKVNMPFIDYITMAGTRNTDNPSYKGGEEEFQAINWPQLMTSLSEKFLGYKDVSSKGVYNPVKPLLYTTEGAKKKIDDINNQINAGYKLMLMIDADLIDDHWDTDSLDLHWVVLESPITWNYTPKFLGVNVDEIDFKVYSWGTNPFGNTRYLRKKITSNHFMSNYNGYIKVK